MIGRRDLATLTLLAAAIAFQFAPVLFTGRTYFLGDLTYFYHPWHSLSAQMLQSGHLPLWNPYGYMGMPLMATMQTGTFAPSTVPFHLFSFAFALKLHELLTHLLAAFFCYLWMRRFTGRAGAGAAAAAFSLGGIMLSRIWIPNQAATLMWLPAIFFFSGRRTLLGITLACSLLAGYPQIWAGMILSALLLPWGRRAGRSWIPALVLAAGGAACLLVPGFEMASHSNRAELTLEQRTAESISASELPALVSPAFLPAADPSGARYPVWKMVYLGIFATACALLGLRVLRLSRAIQVALFALGVVVLASGASNPVSLWLWDALPPLKLLRFPSNLCYLLLPAVIPLIGFGLRSGNYRRWAAAAVVIELLVLGWQLQPTMPDSYFQDSGTVAELLQNSLEGHRYSLSPQAAMLLRGKGKTAEAQYLDVKRRLYGSSNLPFRIASTAGMGESLLLGPTYQVMDFLYTRPSAAEALEYLRWTDTKYLLTMDPPGSKSSWEINEVRAPARAWWLPESEGERLAGGFDGVRKLREAATLIYEEPREDRFRVLGLAPQPGWVLVANPRYPGWKTSAPIQPALTAFQRVHVEAGEIRLEFRYFPLLALLGIAISVLAASGLVWLGRGKAEEAALHLMSLPHTP